jgi:hypothetical protein
MSQNCYEISVKLSLIKKGDVNKIRRLKLTYKQVYILFNISLNVVLGRITAFSKLSFG